MLRHTSFIPDKYIAALTYISKRDGVSVSAHIRIAIEQYIEKKKREHLSVASSPSKSKGGNING